MPHRWDPRAPRPTALVRPVKVDPRGLDGPTWREARSDYWVRTSPGLYVPADTDREVVEQRILEQSMRLPKGGAVTGWAACRLHGANFCDGLERDGVTTIPVPLNVGPRGNLGPGPGARRVRRPLKDDERATRFAIPTVSPLRAVHEAVRLAPDEREAVVLLGAVTAAEIVSLRQAREYDAAGRGRPRMDWALEQASEHSRSPNECRLRLCCELDAGLPRLLVNCHVYDGQGRLLGIADLLDLVAGLVIKFHGAEHRQARRQTADLRKESAMRAVGLEVTGFTGLEIDDRQLVVDRVLEARSRAAFVPEDDRRWVAVPAADDLHQRLLEKRATDEMYEVMDARPDPDIRDLRGW